MKKLYFFALIVTYGVNCAFAQGTNNLMNIKTEVNYIPEPPASFDSVGVQNNNPDTVNVKGVFFVHGLGGDASSLSDLSDTIDMTFDIEYVKVDYSSSYNSIHSAVNSLRQQFFQPTAVDWSDTAGIIPNENIIISHSQGGLVSRYYSQIMQTDNQAFTTFGALITINTPHVGAQILNNQQLIEDLGDNLCKNLKSGPLKEVLTEKFIVKFLGLSGDIEAISDDLCTVISHRLLPILLSENLNPITQDYNVGASWINNLNNFADTIPQIAFYGVEQEPVFHRNMHWLINEPNNEGYFGAKEQLESPTVDEANVVLSQYQSKEAYYSNRKELLGRLAISSIWFQPNAAIPLLLERNRSKKIEEAYRKGKRELLMLNKNWKVIIGQRTLALDTVDMAVCRCEDYYGFTWFESVPETVGCSSMCYTTDQGYQTYNLVWNESLSDGVVNIESQTGNPNAVINIRLDNTSHMQARNGEELDAKLVQNILWFGNRGEEYQLRIK